MNPIRTFISRPVFTGMLTLVVVVFGLVAYPRIGVDQFPEVEFPIVTVTTILPGADPETIERTVTKPLEEALNTLPGLDTLRSVNVENVSQIVIRFDLERKVDVAAQDVRDKVQATLSKLPREIQTPDRRRSSTSAPPGGDPGLLARRCPSSGSPSSPRTSSSRPSSRSPGVGSVELVGGRKREITVVVDPQLAEGLRPRPRPTWSRRSAAQSLDVPGGRTLEPGVERSVKLAAEARSVEALRALVVASPGGTPVRLGDVAQVLDGPAEARSSARARRPRAPSASIVRKQSGANTVQVAERVKEALAGVAGAAARRGAASAWWWTAPSSSAPPSASVQEDMIIGGILAVLVVLLFLRNLRSTLVSAVALPTAIIGTFAVMQALGLHLQRRHHAGADALASASSSTTPSWSSRTSCATSSTGETPREAAREGHRRDRAGGARGDARGGGGLRPGGLHGGADGALLLPVRRHRRGGGAHLLLRLDDAHAHALGARPQRSTSATGACSAGHRAGAAAPSSAVYRRALAWVLGHRALTDGRRRRWCWSSRSCLATRLKFTFIPQQDMSVVKVTLELPAGTTLDETQRAARRPLAADPGRARRDRGLRRRRRRRGARRSTRARSPSTSSPSRRARYGQQELQGVPARDACGSSPAAIARACRTSTPWRAAATAPRWSSSTCAAPTSTSSSPRSRRPAPRC